MLKRVYKTIILIAIFAASIYYFGQNINEVVYRIDETTTMGQTSFPIVTLKTGDDSINLLHGYASSLGANLIRDSITPLDSSQSFFVYIDEKESTVKKVNYELRNTFDNSLVESGSYSALEKVDGQRVAKIKLNSELTQAIEYALKITTVTAESKKINFYTRIMVSPYYHATEMLDFVMNFHNTILDKDKVEEISSYLEPNSAKANDTLNYVNINSNTDLISFGQLAPNIITNVIPTIKEISSDIGSIELEYYMQGTTDDGVEIYHVKEFYRVKYTVTRMYLLNYERTMEAKLDFGLISLSEGEIKLGISSDTPANLYPGQSNNDLCFTRNGDLWYYNIDKNRAVRVFSFAQNDSDYIRDVYDQHDIKVLNMDAEGDIDFIVYGYMNRGNYEGRVGILLYRYYAANNRIEELLYIPVNEPYQILKEHISDFNYLTANDVYYFILNDTIYSYNIITKGLDELATDIGEDDYVFSKEESYIAWQQKEENGFVNEISILHLETGYMTTVEAGKGEILNILGIVDNNIIYGRAKEKDVYTSVSGDQIIPCYRIVIIGSTNTKELLKSYEKKNYYVTNVSVDNNVITLQRVKKTDGTFTNAKEDYILNQSVETTQSIYITKRVTERSLTEHYIALRKNFTLKKAPIVQVSVNTVLSDETSLRLDEKPHGECYYVYAYGGILGSYANAGEAIVAADENVGVVINQNQQKVWARGTRSSIVNLEVEWASSEKSSSSYDECIKILSKYNKGKQSNISPVFSSDTLQVSSEKVGATMVNLTGATLSEVLYYVANRRPVIVAASAKDVALIIGYDSNFITMMDPTSHTISKISLTSATEQFEDNNNVFLSYIE